MKKETQEFLLQVNAPKLNDVVTFEKIQGETNILKAEVFRDGKKHHLYVLTVPEDNFEEEDTVEEQPTHQLKKQLVCT